ncbi:hypothetical protein GUJ93_ZPchr0011g27260 [Zizania palustris]|uniref:Wings apart-like protein C-terminal domain-containing protein n=1 Tax=Zizania palustris TaxID=103762 RepID=A0A8J5WL01_ZIZPA|nr:hypothetical protein GUJ93_ZPchr0011g27260 [Zizania palustris]
MMIQQFKRQDGFGVGFPSLFFPACLPGLHPAASAHLRRLHGLRRLRPPPRPPAASAASAHLHGLRRLHGLPLPPAASARLPGLHPAASAHLHGLRRLHGLPPPPPASLASTHATQRVRGEATPKSLSYARTRSWGEQQGDAMIVRTYGRRSRSFSDGGGGGGEGGGGGGGGFSASQDAFDFDGEDDDLASQPLPLPPSQESSSMWDFGEDPPQPSSQRRRRGMGGRGGGDYAEPAVAATATLMEVEEYGEMMESLDEVNFALDGDNPCMFDCSEFWFHLFARSGLVQQIIDAILVLNFDDPPCTIGAAAILFILASDVQDNHLLDSESCIHFLLKLLNPPVNVVDAKAPSIGSKLLGISKVQMLNGSNKDSDSISEDIISKVEDILLSCQEIKSLNKDDKKMTRPELCPKWLALCPGCSTTPYF